jgi:hypothetical protein
MAHVSSLGASIFSDLSLAVGTAIVPATYDVAGFQALFATADTGTVSDAAIAGGFLRISNVRDFPAIGAPANIVKVPTYGAKQSRQIQGQSDAPNLELTINYVAADWDKTVGLGFFVADGISRAFRFTLMNRDSLGVTAATKYASVALGLGTVENSQWFFVGRMEALIVKPSLTDATTATLTFSMQSEFYGAYTS